MGVDQTNHCVHCGDYVTPGICDPERPFVAHTADLCRESLKTQLADSLMYARVITSETVRDLERRVDEAEAQIEAATRFEFGRRIDWRGREVRVEKRADDNWDVLRFQRDWLGSGWHRLLRGLPLEPALKAAQAVVEPK